MTQIVTSTGFAADTWAGVDAPPLAQYCGGPAVTLDPADDPANLKAHFKALRLVVLPFGSSADGRGFSLAAQLRALGYDGHIRAHGHVLVDQFRAALRAGIDDLAISDAQAARNPEHQWLAVPHTPGYLSQLFVRSPQ